MRNTARFYQWEELNKKLLRCNDERQLRTWLNDMLDAGDTPLYRVLRVYGRLSAVRRKLEIQKIQSRVKPAKELSNENS
jgi:hypothetical protein